MNWYINNAGAAEGPFDDEAMTAMARGKKIASDSLIWHAELEAWSSVALLSPPWWTAALPAMTPEPAPAAKSKKKSVAADAPADSTAPKRRLAAPMAPSEDSSEPKESGGLLKKIFGFGRKKS